MITRDLEHFDYTVLSLPSVFFHKTISQKVFWLEIPSLIKLFIILHFIKRFNIFPVGGLFIYFIFLQATSNEKHISAVQGTGERRLWGGE